MKEAGMVVFDGGGWIGQQDWCKVTGELTAFTTFDATNGPISRYFDFQHH
ncbi:hypothetical protein [Paenibacillus planticolens]|nr:hypothetical protein [Paenibacillus planticolens]